MADNQCSPRALKEFLYHTWPCMLQMIIILKNLIKIKAQAAAQGARVASGNSVPTFATRQNQTQLIITQTRGNLAPNAVVQINQSNNRQQDIDQDYERENVSLNDY